MNLFDDNDAVKGWAKAGLGLVVALVIAALFFQSLIGEALWGLYGKIIASLGAAS